jgi:hypothetical protein
MENEETKDKGRKSSVYRTQDFESYLLWKSLPSVLRGQPRVAIEKFGLDEEITIELLQIKTQKEFALKFGIKDQGTLSDWNRKIEEQGLLDDIHRWARKLTPNVVTALYKNVIKHGRAPEFKTWMEYIENK